MRIRTFTLLISTFAFSGQDLFSDIIPAFDDGTARAGVRSPNDFDPDNAKATGASLTVETFAGINSAGGSQNAPTAATATFSAAAIAPLGSFGTGLATVNRYGPGVWADTVSPKPVGSGQITSYYQLSATPGVYEASGWAGFNSKEGMIYASAALGAAPAKDVRAGAYANDPVPIPTGSYSYAFTLGGMGTYGTLTYGQSITAPTSLEVSPGQIAQISFFADDSNDGTYKSTMSDPIFDFTLTLDGTGSTPVLSAQFTYDPSRISIPGAPTDPALYQSYANVLLASLLADSSDVSLTGAGTFDEILDINNPVTLFNGSYTAAVSSPNAGDSNYPGRIDFEYGDAAGVISTPEPASALILGSAIALMAVSLRFRRLRSGRPNSPLHKGLT